MFFSTFISNAAILMFHDSAFNSINLNFDIFRKQMSQLLFSFFDVFYG